MNKKGDEEALWFKLLELIAAAMVVIIILVAISRIVNNSTYWQKYYSTDVALIYDLENTNQGDFIVNYQLKDLNYSFLSKTYILEDKTFMTQLSKNSVISYDGTDPKINYGFQYPFAKARDVAVAEHSIVSDFLTLSKIGSEQTMDSYYHRDSIQCPSFSSTKDIGNLKFTSISIDDASSSYSKSLGSVLNTLTVNQNSANGATVETTTETKIEATIMLVSSSESQVQAYYYTSDSNSLKSEKLACIFSRDYSAMPIYNYNSSRLLEYDGTFDDNAKLQEYLTNKDSAEYFIIISIPQKYLSGKDLEFSQLVKKSIQEYYQ